MSKKTKRLLIHEPADGFAMVVGGHLPYVSVFIPSLGNPKAREQVQREVSQSYHRAVPAVVLTRADYQRLLKAGAKT